MPRRLRVVGALTGALFLLTSCSSAHAIKGSALGQESGAAVASVCDELHEPAVREATRVTYHDVIAPDSFDMVVARCLIAPHAAVADVVTELIEPVRDSGAVESSFAIMDKDGYTFELALSFTVNTLLSVPSSQPPGLTAADPSVSMAMALVNTTPERDITFKDVTGISRPLSDPTFVLYASFDAGNPVCVLVKETEKGCEWTLGFGRMESGLTVPAGATYALTSYSGVPNGGDVSDLLPGIPEHAWNEIHHELLNPDGYRIRYSGGDSSRFLSPCREQNLMTVLVQTSGSCP